MDVYIALMFTAVLFSALIGCIVGTITHHVMRPSLVRDTAWVYVVLVSLCCFMFVPCFF